MKRGGVTFREREMRVRRSIRTAAAPAALILAAGAGMPSLPGSAIAAAHATRPGKTVPDQTGAAASSVVSVRAWGDNSAGELGDGSLTGRTTPVPVGSLTGVQAISLGGRHDLALTEHFNGTTWSIIPRLDPGQLASLPDNSLDAVASPGGGVVWAVGAQEIPGQCCLRTLALNATAG